MSDLDKANIVTSEVDGSSWLGGLHKPVLDIDFPCKLIPSSTPGHFHLYMDRELSWANYTKLLTVLSDIGLIEAGYVNASIERGYTAVRLPWIKKPLREEKQNSILVFDLVGSTLPNILVDSFSVRI